MTRTFRTLCFALAAVFVFASTLMAQGSVSQAPPAPGNAQGLLKQGRKLASEGKQDEALAAYRKALELSPDLFQAHLLVGMTLDLKGQYKEARQELQKGIQFAPPQSKAQALKTMAISYAFTSDARSAAKYEQQAFDMQLAAKDFYAAGETADELARIYLETGNYNDAEKWYRTGYETGLKKPDIKQPEKDLWEFRWENAQARIAARRGRHTEAEKHVTAARAILDKGDNKDQERFFPYLTGYVAFYAGNYQDAISDLQKADQRDPFVLGLLAQAYEKAGEQAQAMDYYRKVLNIRTHNPNGAFSRPLAEKKVGAASSAG